MNRQIVGVDSPASPIPTVVTSCILMLLGVCSAVLTVSLWLGIFIVPLLLFAGSAFFAIFAVSDVRHHAVWNAVRAMSPNALILRVIPCVSGRSSAILAGSQLGFAPFADSWNLSGTLSVDPDGIRGWDKSKLPHPLFFIPSDAITSVTLHRFHERGQSLQALLFSFVTPGGAGGSLLVAVGASGLTRLSNPDADEVLFRVSSIIHKPRPQRTKP